MRSGEHCVLAPLGTAPHTSRSPSVAGLPMCGQVRGQGGRRSERVRSVCVMSTLHSLFILSLHSLFILDVDSPLCEVQEKWEYNNSRLFIDVPLREVREKGRNAATGTALSERRCRNAPPSGSTALYLHGADAQQ